MTELYDERRIDLPAVIPDYPPEAWRPQYGATRYGEARILDDPDRWDRMPAGVMIPPGDLSRRSHAARLGPASYALERVDKAQPLRTHVPEAHLALGGSVVFWCRVGLAVLGTLLLAVAMVASAVKWGPW